MEGGRLGRRGGGSFALLDLEEESLHSSLNGVAGLVGKGLGEMDVSITSFALVSVGEQDLTVFFPEEKVRLGESRRW